MRPAASSSTGGSRTAGSQTVNRSERTARATTEQPMISRPRRITSLPLPVTTGVTVRAARAPPPVISSCSRRNGRGDHQLASPSSAISDGTSSERTTSASSRTPNAVAIPICWMNEIWLVANAPIATASRIAAAVSTRPVRRRR